MGYDTAMRHREALDPSALVTITTSLHALGRAIDDCRNAGCDAETDPAVLLLARHLGSVATDGRSEGTQLRRSCMDAITALKQTPVLVVLAHKGVAYDEGAKTLFHAEGRKAMRQLADALGLLKGRFDLRSNKAGPAVSGEITLHAEEIYVQLSLGFGQEVMFRSVRGRRDFTGGQNHWASVHDLLEPHRFAARIRRELRFPMVDEARTRLFD